MTAALSASTWPHRLSTLAHTDTRCSAVFRLKSRVIGELGNWDRLVCSILYFNKYWEACKIVSACTPNPPPRPHWFLKFSSSSRKQSQSRLAFAGLLAFVGGIGAVTQTETDYRKQGVDSFWGPLTWRYLIGCSGANFTPFIMIDTVDQLRLATACCQIRVTPQKRSTASRSWSEWRASSTRTSCQWADTFFNVFLLGFCWGYT